MGRYTYHLSKTNKLAVGETKMNVKRGLISFAAMFIMPTTLATTTESTRTFTFYISAHNLEEYRRYLNGREPTNITDPTSKEASRHTIELLIFQKAMAESPCRCVVEYRAISTPTTHIRSIANVAAGRMVSHPIAGFSNDPRYSDNVLLSTPILAAEDFFVGLYTHAGRRHILELSDVNKIRKLRFTAARTWVVDLKVIHRFGFPLIKADSWDSALKMLRTGRADVIMQPFSPTKDFGFVDVLSGERFLPIPGIKLFFGAERRYAVSKRHPDAHFFSKNLNAGINKLKKSGFLRMAHVAAGLISSRTANWRIIVSGK